MEKNKMTQKFELPIKTIEKMTVGELKKLHKEIDQLKEIKAVQDALSESLRLQNYFARQEELKKSLFEND